MIEAVASIARLTAFGTQTVGNLYRFGCNDSSASEQVARIGDRISDYLPILDVLEGLINQDMTLISTKAEEMIDRLCEQSYDMFEEIVVLIPHHREELNFNPYRIAWSFRKVKVEHMLGQVEYMKSNALLLIVTILLAKKVRYFGGETNALTKEQQEAFDGQATRANYAAVQHLNAADKLQKLENELKHADAPSPESTGGNTATASIISDTNPGTSLRSYQPDILADFRKSMANAPDASTRQTIMMKRSPQLSRGLLREWTRVYEPKTAGSGTGRRDEEPRRAATDQISENLTAPGTFDSSKVPKRDTAKSSVRVHEMPKRHSRERESKNRIATNRSSEHAKVQVNTDGSWLPRSQQPLASNDSPRAEWQPASGSTLPTARHKPQTSIPRPSTATRQPASGDSSDEGDSARLWESSFDKTKEYIEKAAADMGKLPPFERHESGSFWSSTLRESKDSDPQPTSSKGRHSYEEETLRPHPLMSTQSFNSTIPKNFSNLKYTKTHDSGYGNSSSRYIPGPREDSPLRRMTKSRYTFVDPDSDDDRASRIHRVYDNADRRRRYASPEPVSEKQQSQTPRDSIRSPRAEAFARYDDVRTRDFAPGSRFQAADDTAPKRSKGRYQE